MGVLLDTKVQPEAVGKKEIMSNSNKTINTYIITIDVVRHGEKNDDTMTERGAEQIRATAVELTLAEGPRDVGLLVHSGANRTMQAIAIIADTFGYDPVFAFPDDKFNFTNLIGPSGGKDVVLAEIAKVQSEGDTVALALASSKYARLARDQITHAILALARDVIENGYSRAVVTSHGPYTELAAVNPEQMPYGICEGDWVRYEVVDGQIISSTLHRCPIPGRRN